MSDKYKQSGGENVENLLDEVSKLKAEIKELRFFRDLAYRDSLTSLRNRRYLERRLDEELHRCERQPDHPFSLVMLDLDDFKELNDTHGHHQGDSALCWLANFITEEIRSHDIPCRVGGDEFLVILTDTDAAGCQLLIERLQARLNQANTARAIPLAFSIGGATWPQDGESRDTLLEAVDRAMYLDKMNRKLGTSEKTSTSKKRSDETFL